MHLQLWLQMKVNMKIPSFLATFSATMLVHPFFFGGDEVVYNPKSSAMQAKGQDNQIKHGTLKAKADFKLDAAAYIYLSVFDLVGIDYNPICCNQHRQAGYGSLLVPLQGASVDNDK